MKKVSRVISAALVIAILTMATAMVSADAALRLAEWLRLNRLNLAEETPQYEASYTPFAQADIRETEQGRRYVASQLLVSAAEGTSREEMEALFANIGGRAVGYIEISGDYQVQLEGEHAYDELQDLCKALNENPAVACATPNDLYQMSTEALKDTAREFAEFSSTALEKGRSLIRRPNLPGRNAVNTKTLLQRRYDQILEEELSGDRWIDNSGDAKNLEDQAGFGTLLYPDGNKWWAQAVYLPLAWHRSESLANATVRVGAIDGMFDERHPDLAIRRTFNNPADIDAFINALGTKEAKDRASGGVNHGTHVLGLMGAQEGNGMGIRGAGGSNVELYGYAMFGERPEGEAFESGIFMFKHAIATLLGQGVRIINISMGFDQITTSAYYDDVLNNRATHRGLDEINDMASSMEAFIERCDKAYPNFLIFTSAGNNSGYPWVKTNDPNDYSLRRYDADKGDSKSDIISVGVSADYGFLGRISKTSAARKHLVVVGSYDAEYIYRASEDRTVSNEDAHSTYYKSSFSDFEADIYAPGGTLTAIKDGQVRYFEILSTVYGNGADSTDMMIGTSMASPITAGVAALVWSSYPQLTSEELRACILDQGLAYSVLSGFLADQLPVLDASAALMKAHQIAGVSEYMTAEANNPNGDGFLLGLGYVKDANGDTRTAKNAIIHVYDESWNEMLPAFDQDGMDSFALLLPPGEYYYRIVSDDPRRLDEDPIPQVEHIGEVEIKANEVTYVGDELTNRPKAMYDFACYQTTKRGEWYESGEGQIYAGINLLEVAAEVAYDYQVTDYDPDNPQALRADGRGVMTTGALGLSATMSYTVDYHDDRTSASCSMMGISMGMGDIPGDPGLFDLLDVQEEQLTNVTDIDDYFFTVDLDQDQLSAFNFTGFALAQSIDGSLMQNGVMTVQLKRDLSLDNISIYAEVSASDENYQADLGGATLQIPIEAGMAFQLSWQFSDREINLAPDPGVPGNAENLDELVNSILGGI